MGLGAKVFGILFLIFALGTALYFSRSGVFTREPSSATSAPDGSTTTDPYAGYYWQSVSGPGYLTWEEWVKSQGSGSSVGDGGSVVTPVIDPRDVPQGFRVDQISPYWRKVRISSVRSASGDFYGEIRVTSWLQSDETVNVTGWWISSNKKGKSVIPRAVGVYSPYGTSPELDIVLKGVQSVFLYSPPNTVGPDLRLNKCVGYLENALDFTPPLPAQCPHEVSRDKISHLTGACQDYLLSLGVCGEADPNAPGLLNDDACQEYFRDLNYRGCFDNHRFEEDFLGDEWWVWLGVGFPNLDARHDRVFLFDNRGLLVDEYVY